MKFGDKFKQPDHVITIFSTDLNRLYARAQTSKKLLVYLKFIKLPIKLAENLQREGKIYKVF